METKFTFHLTEPIYMFLILFQSHVQLNYLSNLIFEIQRTRNFHWASKFQSANKSLIF